MNVDLICLSWTVEETLNHEDEISLDSALLKARNKNITIFGAIDDDQPESELLPGSSPYVYATRHVDIINPPRISTDDPKRVVYLLPSKGIQIKLPKYLYRDGTYVTDGGSSYTAAIATGLVSLVLSCVVFAFGHEDNAFENIKQHTSMSVLLEALCPKRSAESAQQFLRPWKKFPKHLSKDRYKDDVVILFQELLKRWTSKVAYH
jgi:hypothetical protein